MLNTFRYQIRFCFLQGSRWKRCHWSPWGKSTEFKQQGNSSAEAGTHCFYCLWLTTFISQECYTIASFVYVTEMLSSAEYGKRAVNNQNYNHCASHPLEGSQCQPVWEVSVSHHVCTESTTHSTGEPRGCSHLLKFYLLWKIRGKRMSNRPKLVLHINIFIFFLSIHGTWEGILTRTLAYGNDWVLFAFEWLGLPAEH